METQLQSTSYIWYAIVSLTLAAFAYIGFLVSPKAWRSKPLLSKAGWALIALAFILSGLGLYIRSGEAGYFALSNMFESLVVVSMGIEMGFLLMSLKLPMNGLGWMVATLCLATVGFATSLPTDIAPLQAALQSYWRAIHVPIILASYAMFALAFISSVATLGSHVQAKRLAGRTEPAEVSVTSAVEERLHWLDEITYRCTMLGFPLLTLGIILGGLWANEAWGNYWSWDPKESMSLATLLGYGVYMHLRINGSLSPIGLAWVQVGAFVLLLVTYFGVNLMGLGLHSYGRIG